MSSYITNLPVNGTFNVTAIYKQKNKSLWKDYHKGIDITGNKKIYSICDGIVKAVSFDEKGWGQYISIQPNGFPDIRFIFCHLVKGSQKVKIGDKVNRTTHIGTMGTTGNSTGVHLHIQMNYKGKDVDVSKYLGIPNAKATKLIDKNYAVTDKNKDAYLYELTKSTCDVCEDLESKVKALETENKNLKETIKNIKNLIEKWSV